MSKSVVKCRKVQWNIVKYSESHSNRMSNIIWRYIITRIFFFYIHGFVHHNFRLKKSNKMQQYADIYLLLNYSTCFGHPSRLSSGVHKTIVVPSGTDHTMWGISFLKHDQIWSRLRKLAYQIVWSVPEAATTVLCTPDDGRDGRPKQVE